MTKAITLKPTKDRAVVNRHPWIFSGALEKVADDIKIGDEIVVKNYRGDGIARGHYCGKEGLAVRIISFDADAVVDDKFWLDRFHQALHMRKNCGLPNASTNGYRLLHGEGDLLSGLVCDIFGDCASISSTNPGMASKINLLADFVRSECGVRAVHVANSGWIDNNVSDGRFVENGLAFNACVTLGQKTGHFLDQRDNRALVRDFSAGKKVLDAFCYSGGFSVYARAGGALRVTSVDISRSALEKCVEHIEINPGNGAHEAILADCFDYLREMPEGHFDLMVLDPPAFAKSAAAVARGARGYKDINLCAFKTIKSNGLVFTYSCSQHVSMELFKQIIYAAAKDSGREVTVVKELTQGVDHPVSIYCPQSSYLKGLALYVR